MYPTDAVPVQSSANNEMLNPQIVYSWKAPVRAYKKRSKYVLRFYLAVAILLSILIFLLGDKILILPIWAVLFLFYVLTITPPPIVENKISKFGIEAVGVTLRWESLSHFYFVDRFGFPILTLVGPPPFFTHTFLVVPSEEIRKQLIRILAEHIVYQDRPTLTLTDRIINVLSYLMPEDEEEEVKKQTATGQSTDIVGPKDDLTAVKDTLVHLFQKQQPPVPAPPSVSPR